MTIASKMSSTLVRQQIERFVEVLNEQDIPKAMEFFTDDVVWAEPLNEPVVGRAEAERLLREMFQMMPDLHFDLDPDQVHVSEDGAHGVATWRITGTMTGIGEPLDYLPTGKKASLQGVCLYEFRDGRIARHTIIYDALDLMQQIGLLPAQDSLTTKVLAGVHNVTTRVTHALHR